MFAKISKSKLCVGIDIGASSVKLCQIKKSKKETTLESFGLVPLPPEAVVDGALMNSGRIVDAILELVAAHKIKHKQVAISVSGHSVIIKKISMPQMTRDMLEESIQFEAEQFIPFAMQDVNLDVQIVNPQSKQQGQMDVVLVAAKKDLVNEYTSVIVEAGLEPVICDVDAFAVENMFEAGYEATEQTIALVNVGASKTNINILSQQISSFTRDLTIGGNAITEEIQKQLNVSFEEAEEYKITASDKPQTVPAPVNHAIQTVVHTIVGEVQRSIDFYAATSADSTLGHVYLTGGTARVPPLVKIMGDRIGVPVAVANPFAKMQMKATADKAYLMSIAPQAAVAVGLALRYPGDA